MKQLGMELVKSTENSVAKSDYDQSSISEPDFAFAFDDSNFSDRILRVEIIPDLTDSKSNGEDCSTIADWARNRKRRREDFRKENGGYIFVQSSDQLSNYSLADSDDVAYETLDGDAVAMIEESPLMDGNEAVQDNESPLKIDSPAVLRVRTVHISSPILAAKSPFFYKLFSNGMRESDQRQVTLRIHASEEAALMDLLNFIYSGTLQTNTPTGVLDVLMAADKFEVASCMRYCSHMLRKFTMTSESALLYLDLPSSVLMAEAVKPLTDEAKKFLALRFKDMAKYHEEVMNLPLAGIEAVLCSDQLQVASEDAVYDFAVKWARTHYPDLEQRREVLGTRLCKLIRFPYMTCRKLKKVLTCNDIETDLASRLVMEALFFKAEPPYRQRALLADVANTSTNVNFCRYIERAYKYRPVKVVEFETPRQQCVVYLDLKKEECQNLHPSGRVYSQAFHLGGQGFFLSAHCNMDQQSSFHCFGLFLGMQEKGSVTFTVEYEFGARQKTSDDYMSRYRGNYTFMGGKAVGYRNLFGVPWTSFMADDSPFFVNDVLHLRAELTIKQ
ncbi:BTB/POZ domain-containing protein POB1-like [Silene latifolia]|uniref:BTB/POZ domain-containing protein POB1-like n=1 Tax=Silene latifolia TaxID=37657 RepID=UPI003D76B19A